MRIRPGPADTPEELVVRLSFTLGLCLCGALVYGLAYGLWHWRIAHFAHAVATISEVWNEERRTRHRNYIATVGRLRFTRTHNGKSYDCDFVTDIGEASDNFKVGDKLDIVPATGTCQRVDIIGRLP